MKRPMSVTFFLNTWAAASVSMKDFWQQRWASRVLGERNVHVLAIGAKPHVNPQSLWSQMGALPRAEFWSKRDFRHKAALNTECNRFVI